MIYKNGDVYIGDWNKGEKHGIGNYFCNKSQNSYEGYWKNGKKHGKGIFIWQAK